ncbi:UvrD-helicase domain-containing protein [Gordonia sp. NPDC003585]|uniref:UvrD-helicase domain-containing protein n=1 Tax=Gordonia sp. NPDC003585 TaxID=3154275 RepID=UPI00339F924A
MLNSEVELDASQRAVAEAASDARLLVIAGAGQGKTEVVASRIQFLVDEEDLSASTEIMVLSFSRAAVQAVRTRLEVHDIARTDVRTFDSLASYLLSQNGKEPVGSFDNRVRQATQLLNDKSNDVEGIEDLQHLVLDEVQDLVGDRAEMILALLRRMDDAAGFTALGDPLQGIYDFTLAESRSKRTSTDFADCLVDVFGAEKVSLARNYRARGLFPNGVVDLGNQLRAQQERDAAETVTQFERTLPHSGVIKNWGFLAEPDSGRTAILCATNGEALRVSRFLTEQGVDHVVRRQAREFGAARWIAGVFEDFAGPEVDRESVQSVIEAKLAARLQDEAWYLLKGAEGRSRSMYQLNLPRVRSLITSGALPLTLTEPDESRVIVSTIHRAKGLEFDRAYFVHPNSPMGDQDAWPALRQKYVALSRARDEVAVLDIPTGWMWFDKRNGRQRERKKSKQGKKYSAAIEFGAGDVLTARPASDDSARAREIQEVLKVASPGESVIGTVEPGLSTDDVPVFVLRTDAGMELGVTNEWFGRAIADEFGYRFRDGWDGVVIDGLRLVAVETVAGDPHLTEEAGLGSSGMWLVPRVFGLVTPHLP